MTIEEELRQLVKNVHFEYEYVPSNSSHENTYHINNRSIKSKSNIIGKHNKKMSSIFCYDSTWDK